MAEVVGFEPTDLLQSLVFKTSAINQTLPRFLKPVPIIYIQCFGGSILIAAIDCILGLFSTRQFGSPASTRTRIPDFKGRSSTIKLQVINLLKTI